MGHLVGKDIYRKLGKKIDNLTLRAPWNDTLFAILKEIYTEEEANVVVRMPYVLSNLERIAKITGYEPVRLRTLIDGLCDKGLILDLWVNDEYNYMPSPLMVGIFEFTMMRTGNTVNSKELGKLFHEYIDDNKAFFSANFNDDMRISIMRTLPHEEAIKQGEYMEILDYEKASELIESSSKFAIGLCSCRHEKHHAGKKNCDVPLESCTTFGYGADYIIRHNLGREISQSEMRDHFVRSKEMGLVLNADNVQNNLAFVCHCCKCCCNPLLGIRVSGYPHSLVTSNFIAEIDASACVGCGKCAKACPIEAIEMVPVAKGQGKGKKLAKVDSSICFGCGVCALPCKFDACQLSKRGQRVIHPETTFERVMLQCLERGTLQNQIFDNPQSLGHKFMRGFVGGFLNLSPVKRALMSDTMRSRFLNAMKKGVETQGKGWLADM
ncbi:MAG: 4Fe-4S ferredoxin [Desulfuromonadales bacterium C00003094]|jgi:ferredoxin|nr:MAG: 4Fe-4S ferredoxin [Desulfuromonadales bacterium C00003094]OEU73992.1 MAG: 4Fe-4S ferredoxin [Desulfuromonadales bacterium C00003107]